MSLCRKDPAMRLSSRTFLVACLTALAALPAMADKRWSLDSAVPDDVYLYVHTVKNPENEFLEAYWAQVWEAFWNVGLLDEVKGLILSKIPEAPATPDQPEQPSPRAVYKEKLNQLTGLVKQVDWKELLGNEFAYAQRMAIPNQSHLYLFRMDRKMADKNAAGLKAILKGIPGLAGMGEGGALTVTESERHGAKICLLELGGEVSLAVAQRGDTIAVGFETTLVHVEDEGRPAAANHGPTNRMLDSALRLLNGDKTVKRLIDRENFKRAMAELPKPENERFFFDAGNLFDSLQKGLDVVQTSIIPEADQADTAPIMRAVQKAIDHLRFIDCSASVELTEGFSTHCYSVTVMTPNAKDKPLYRAFCGTPPVKEFDKYIPKKATGFNVSSGIEWLALYEAVIGFVRDDVPGGQEKLAEWDAIQEKMGLRLDRDILSWMGDTMISVSMPPVIPNPFGGEDWVLLMKVKDEARARQTIESGVAALTALLSGNQGKMPLTTQPAQNPSLEGFISVTYQPLMMFFRPIYGFADGFLIIGSSENVINRCLKTARGESPSVRENKRFQEEGLMPSGPVTGISFADKSQMGQQLAQAMGMLGMFGGMIPMPEEEAAQIVRTIFNMLQKLAPVVAQINFYRSKASVCTFDGKIYRSETVTNYKKPAPPEPEAEEETTAAAPPKT
ncbi:MAG: hypothetical protein JSU68_02135 [Phycisphaerales bacterium]|nr:MAG: hypothetical protein JSU68_02135 [Phycisphaerales bacterium]